MLSPNGRPRIDASVTLLPRLEDEPDAVLPPAASGDDVIDDAVELPARTAEYLG